MRIPRTPVVSEAMVGRRTFSPALNGKDWLIIYQAIIISKNASIRKDVIMTNIKKQVWIAMLIISLKLA